MKKLFTFILILFIGTVMFSQQENQFTQFMYNKLVLNPAHAGVRNTPSVTLMYRNQWLGFEGAPKAMLANFEAPFFGDRVGVGFSVSNYKKGIMDSWYTSLAYAYKLKFSDEVHLRLGMHATLRYLGIDFNSPSVILNEENDPAIADVQSDIAKQYKGNVGIGLYFTFRDLYAGFSVPRLYPNFIGFNGSTLTAQEKRHLYFMAGGLFPLNENIAIRPSLLLKYVNNAPFDFDINVTGIYNERIHAGVSYRYGGDGFAESVDLNLFYNVNNQIGIGFAYDFTLSELSNYSNGTIEALIRADLVTEKDELSNPRFFE